MRLIVSRDFLSIYKFLCDLSIGGQQNLIEVEFPPQIFAVSCWSFQLWTYLQSHSAPWRSLYQMFLVEPSDAEIQDVNILWVTAFDDACGREEFKRTSFFLSFDLFETLGLHVQLTQLVMCRIWFDGTMFISYVHISTREKQHCCVSCIIWDFNQERWFIIRHERWSALSKHFKLFSWALTSLAVDLWVCWDLYWFSCAPLHWSSISLLHFAVDSKKRIRKELCEKDNVCLFVYEDASLAETCLSAPSRGCHVKYRLGLLCNEM